MTEKEIIAKIISTHVPMRGTTMVIGSCYGSIIISTHVPMRGTTTAREPHESGAVYFNPRPHAGDDVI